MLYHFSVRLTMKTNVAPVIKVVATKDMTGAGYKGKLEAATERDAAIAAARGVFPDLSGSATMKHIAGKYLVLASGPGLSDVDFVTCVGTITIIASKKR
jgi:hypothetical protein